MPTICNKVNVQAFYSKNPLHGYVKAMIYTLLGEDGHRYERIHPCSPLYAPFTFQRKKYRLHSQKAVKAEDITSEDADIFDKEWKLHPLEIKMYEKERMNVIFKRMEESLETLVQQAVPLNQKKMESKRRFLGIFPAPLREGFNEDEMYGTIGGKQLSFRIYLEELPSYHGELTVTPSLKPNRIPIRLFNRS
ncbi:MAG: hypothetical protein Q7K45_03000 [Nanoarchaeota archaeon]|nr:hypothetical protein [Nanoarchaeota archaeon]